MKQIPSIIEHEAGKALQCRNCEYEWRYRGNLIFASCPSCRHAVKAKNFIKESNPGPQDQSQARIPSSSVGGGSP